MRETGLRDTTAPCQNDPMSASPTSIAPRILVIRRRYLGDIVLLGAVFRALKAHWPQAHLAGLVQPAYADVLSINPDVSTILRLPVRWFKWPGFLREIRRAGFTHVLDLDNTERTALIARASGAAIRVLLYHGQLRPKLPGLYTHRVHDPSERHERLPITDYYLRSLEPLGVPLTDRRVKLEPRAPEVAALQRYVGAAGPVVLVHPGSRSPNRVWPAANFATICDRVQDELGAQVVLVGGPGERPLLEQIRGHMHTHATVFERTLSIPQFSALARLSAVLLCHDSGPMHVAAATGTRVVAILGSQNAAVFPPSGEGHTLLQPPLPCTRCVAPDHCVRGDSYRTLCVHNVSVERVFDALAATLGRS